MADTILTDNALHALLLHILGGGLSGNSSQYSMVPPGTQKATNVLQMLAEAGDRKLIDGQEYESTGPEGKYIDGKFWPQQFLSPSKDTKPNDRNPQNWEYWTPVPKERPMS